MYVAITRTLGTIAGLVLSIALALTIGTTIGELSNRADIGNGVSPYPVAVPSPEQATVLRTTLAPLPALDAEWGWAELDVRGSCAVTIQRARLVLLDPDMRCDLRGTIFHEWGHLAQIKYYGGDTTPDGELVSDVVDKKTGQPYRVAVQEVAADCISVLLVGEYGGEQPPRSYLPMIGGCPVDLLALARDMVTGAGVRLDPGSAVPLDVAGAGAA